MFLFWACGAAGWGKPCTGPHAWCVSQALHPLEQHSIPRTAPFSSMLWRNVEPSFKCDRIFRNTHSMTMHTYSKVVWHIFSSFTSYKSVTWHQSIPMWCGLVSAEFMTVRDDTTRARFQGPISAGAWMTLPHFEFNIRVPLGTSTKQNKYFHLCSENTLGSRAEWQTSLR